MTGRPSSYTPELAAEICRRISEGESLKRVCGDEGMPARSTVQLWIINDTSGFSGMYARAREAQAHAWADEILDVAEDGSNDWMERTGKDDAPGYVLNGEHVQRSRLRVDTRKWLMSKMLPKVYGEKLEVEATVKQATLTDEPLNEDDWSKRYGPGGVAASGGSAEGAG
ncbi:hypothetical protein [Roseomonas gilardii]|uniref:terminase small subunit-like protein n=1 Tax=Roseomonas gilardii TaxID=257708 RepID=UPI001AD802B8|nr:hypothetical protein [Roseomonas gilardii]